MTHAACAQDGGHNGDVRGAWRCVSGGGASGPSCTSDPAQRQHSAGVTKPEHRQGVRAWAHCAPCNGSAVQIKPTRKLHFQSTSWHLLQARMAVFCNCHTACGSSGSGYSSSAKRKHCWLLWQKICIRSTFSTEQKRFLFIMSRHFDSRVSF